MASRYVAPVGFGGVADYVTAEEANQGLSAIRQGGTWLDRIVDAAKKVIPGAVSTAQAALAQLSYSGSTGNFQSAEETIALTAKFQPIVDQFPDKIGSPLYKAVVINTLSGFVLCKDATIALTIATGHEEEAITSFLNGGFYYE
jgi:hypothetical protein